MRLWTRELFTVLQAVPSDVPRWTVKYQIAAQELKESVLRGCAFCRTLADGINGRLFLDELYERFRSYDPGNSDENSSDQEDIVVEQDIEDEKNSICDVKWNDASAFNEEEIDDDPTGGWDAWEERDTLTSECGFKVVVSFERGEGGQFTFVNVRIEASDERKIEMNELQKLRGERAVDLRYHVNIAGTNPLLVRSLNLCMLGGQANGHSFPTETIGTALGSDVNMDYISKWTRSLSVIPTIDTTQMPSRLIDLGSGYGLRIVDTSRISTKVYGRGFAALSYVWGTNQTFILLKENKDALMTSFEMQRLPQTIQDAVAVTRRIGLRYIWVDALCIVQNSNNDKAQELPKMRLIYKCAAVTIVAAVAKTASEGFLHLVEEPAYFINPIEIPYLAGVEPELACSLVLSYPADYKRWKDPINARAWTFQELLLSQRVILFSYRGVQTIDRTSIPDADGLTSGKDPQLPNLPWNGRLFSLDSNSENARQIWLAVRGEYSRRILTYQGDKLLAIAAVAEEIARGYGTRYIAGMWERDLAFDLQWQRPGAELADSQDVTCQAKPQARSKDYVAPSWSWASIQGEIDDFTQITKGEAVEDGQGMKAPLAFQVVSCHVEPALPGFMYGAVKSGTLVVKGRMRRFFWRPQHWTLENSSCDGFLTFKDESEPHKEIVAGEALIDALEPELVDDCVVVCVVTRLTKNVAGKDETAGLMLLPVDDEQHRRVGFFKINHNFPMLFDELEPTQITII